MKRHKDIDEQVIVVTGATSGIGLATTRMAAKRGARLVVTARSEEALRDLVAEIEAGGSEAVYVAGDIADESTVRAVADAAVERFGGFDTWVNNAAVSIYGSIIEVDVSDQRRLFETNYWGTVYGSLMAVEHLRKRGGALINVGSVLSDRSIPKQGPYCASKHAIKGFTDSLRMEIEEDKLPISVTLIKPSAIDTPYKDNAKNYLDRAPKNPPPVYAPSIVAKAILHCAVRPQRDVIVGGGGSVISVLGVTFPRFTDFVMERTMSKLQMTDEPADEFEKHNLHHPLLDGEERGGYPHHVSESSLYTTATLHPLITGAALLALGAGAVAAKTVRRNGKSSSFF